MIAYSCFIIFALTFGLFMKILSLLPARLRSISLYEDKEQPPYYIRNSSEVLKPIRVDGIFNVGYKTSRLDIGWYPKKDRPHQRAVDTKRQIIMIYTFYIHLEGNDVVWGGIKLEKIKGPVALLWWEILNMLEYRCKRHTALKIT
jgi:hypothetical protein